MKMLCFDHARFSFMFSAALSNQKSYFGISCNAAFDLFAASFPDPFTAGKRTSAAKPHIIGILGVSLGYY